MTITLCVAVFDESNRPSWASETSGLWDFLILNRLNLLDTLWAVILPGAAIAAVPVLILDTFVQRYAIEGVASSGIKG